MFWKRVIALTLCAALLFTLASCKKGGAKNADKTINYNLSAEPETLDPQVAADTPSIIAIQALFEGLTRLDASGKVIPGAAEKWTSDESGTKFTFTLRSGAKWSDKTPVTSSDFVFAFQRALDPKTGSSTCTQMYCIKNARKVHSGKLPVSQLGVTAPDSHTLAVEMEYPCPDFAKLAANLVFMPCNENFFNQSAGRYGLEIKYLLGNGPFVIDGKYGWDHGKYLNLIRSSTYSGQQTPLPAAVVFSIGNGTADMSNPVAALAAGTVDAAPVTSAQADAAKAAGCTLSSVQDTTWGLCFNTQSAIFRNLSVRRAFLQAFDRKKALSHLPKDTLAAENIILPGTTLDGANYRSMAGGPFYLKQGANAAQTLEAGLSGLGLSKSASAAALSSVTVLCPDDANAKLMVNEMIAAWNAQFHNYFNMDPMSRNDLLSAVQSGNYDLAVYPLKPTADGPFLPLYQFCSGVSGNPARWSNVFYDSLVTSAQSKSGREAAAAYASAEKMLSEQAVFYPLYYEKSYFALAKGVTGVVFRPYQGGVDFINAGKAS